jgi:hypothetical protein
LVADEKHPTHCGSQPIHARAGGAGLGCPPEGQQIAVMARAGVTGSMVHQYTTVLNGFAAHMTPQQAARMAAQPVSVVPDELRRLDTSSTPSFLGLRGPGLYATTSAKGEDVVIGIVDSGIWFEHPSLRRHGLRPGTRRLRHLRSRSRVHQRQLQQAHRRASSTPLRRQRRHFGDVPYEYNSPRCQWPWHAHLHHQQRSCVDGRQRSRRPGPMRIIAPARIATYKVCWGAAWSPAELLQRRQRRGDRASS